MSKKAEELAILIIGIDPKDCLKNSPMQHKAEETITETAALIDAAFSEVRDDERKRIEKEGL